MTKKRTLITAAAGNVRARREKLYSDDKVSQCDVPEHLRVRVGGARVWKAEVTVRSEAFWHSLSSWASATKEIERHDATLRACGDGHEQQVRKESEKIKVVATSWQKGAHRPRGARAQHTKRQC